ncbi:NADPH:quinone reductase-like Zn-dependent oxidoreductase [Algoriphagus sp. 4150]|uniref:NADP-dependent oxidoreductase n=1 Tax=Algoriphagus sp. 4150 TaxID=2817756 RepID=UPI00285E7967|nr:NADP-dependent oxidoreductase [Algoriphagus sp. 4150]MDR7127934.1 NADPH:quinone reductase-like Zn-dependent oxidoreductase [Algoriphagus sp. 4150]
MKTIIVEQPGDVNQLIYSEAEKSTASSDEVLIKVKSLSINPVDIKTHNGNGVYGRIKTESPLILGWDIAGVVENVGAEVSKFKIGDEVFGMVNFPGHGKAYAEYVVAPENQLALKPENVSFEEAAASTLAALTAWQAMVKNAKVKGGQKVLVHAAAGGVGHFAVQIGKYLGAEVTGTSSAKNRDFVLSLGADSHLDYRNYDWENHPEEFDFVLDTIGGDNIDHSILVTKKGGSVISIPTTLNEAVGEKAKAKGVNGYFFLVQSDGEDMKQIALLLEKGHIKASVEQVFPFSQMKRAHLQLETGRTVGKIVVNM